MHHITGPNLFLASIDPSTSDPLSASDKHLIQSIVGTFLYYARDVDPTMLVPLNELSSTQKSNPTKETLAKFHRLLNYAST